ncbi:MULTISPECIES: CGNR zinc finger domain-containing protein [unclassified Streptomyces]|uniref:CGNR zinc finger domain-containing protein n=1 Tax=unclassified Streptomyces TaxID=2593676 RepID=UPI0036F882B8
MHSPLPDGPWEVLRRSIVRARQEAELPPVLPRRWQVRATAFEDLAHALALQADELLASPLVQRIRRCEGPGCGWFFLDRSRSGTRRWCSPGDCGNRDRARRHYHRSRALSDPPPPPPTARGRARPQRPGGRPTALKREHGRAQARRTRARRRAPSPSAPVPTCSTASLRSSPRSRPQCYRAIRCAARHA